MAYTRKELLRNLKKGREILLAKRKAIIKSKGYGYVKERVQSTNRIEDRARRHYIGKNKRPKR